MQTKDMQTGNVKTEEKIRFRAYASLIFGIIFFSGILGELSKLGDGKWTWLGAFDFTILLGKFGTLGNIAKESGTLATSFRGIGGSGPRDAFMYAVTLAPQVIFALGVVKIIEDLGAMKAAEKLLTPILRFVLGIPGSCALPLVTGLQSTDAASSMIKSLSNDNYITEKEKLIITSFQFSASGTILNYFTIGGAVFGLLKVPILLPLLAILLCKFIGANIVRILVNKIIKE